MIHKACMPVYMNSGKIVADGTGRVGKSKVLQEVLADLKSCARKFYNIFVSKFVDAAGYVVINIEGRVQCLQCGATMKHMRNYKRHLEDKHSDNTNNHYCGYCGKVYGSKNSLSTHMYSYHREQYLSDKGRLDLSSGKSDA